MGQIIENFDFGQNFQKNFDFFLKFRKISILVNFSKNFDFGRNFD